MYIDIVDELDSSYKSRVSYSYSTLGMYVKYS